MRRTCYLCGKIFSTEELHREHTQLHEIDRRRTRCLACDDQFSLKSKFISHYLEIHDQNPFKCSKCEYETNLKNNLKIHHSCHWFKGIYKCDKCSYSGTRMRNVNEHQMNHH